MNKINEKNVFLIYFVIFENIFFEQNPKALKINTGHSIPNEDLIVFLSHENVPAFRVLGSLFRFWTAKDKRRSEKEAYLSRLDVLHRDVN